MALLSGSPAIDAVNPSGCTNLDFHQLQLQLPERLEPIQIQNVVQTAL